MTLGLEFQFQNGTIRRKMCGDENFTIEDISIPKWYD